MSRKKWTPEEIEYLIKLYPDTKTETLAKHLNRPLSGVYGKAKSLNIGKSEAFKASVESGRLQNGTTLGSANFFKPGHPSFNKGKKMEEYLSADKIERFKANSFKKGNVPHNTKSDGAVTVRNYKGRNYHLYRVGKNDWKFLHVVIWEKQNGTVPHGHVITFKDGNTAHLDINNLQCISLKENMLKNTIHNLPPEIKELIIITTRINRKIKKLTNHG